MNKLLLLVIFLVVTTASAQDSTWTLQRCVDYAIENNLTIKQSELDYKLSLVDENSAKMGRYPNLSLSTNTGLNLGRSINPTTNQFENTQFTYSGLSASTGVLLFGWFQKRHQIEKSKIQVLHANENYEQLKDDILLNISTAYLRALLAKEQIANVAYQIDISMENKKRLEKLLDAGKSNILERSQVETQLATDSALYLQAVLTYEQSLIELKAVMNFEFDQPMSIAPLMVKEMDQYFHYEPENVFQSAQNHFHTVKADEYAIQIARKDLQITKAGSLPNINLFYSTGTNYSSSFYEYLPSGERQLMNFGRQLNSNLSHSIGAGLSIPIFNNFTVRNSIKSSKLKIEKAYIAKQEGLQKLRKDIYSACTDYELALQKFRNSLNILNHSQNAYNAATVRHETGLINYFELITEKGNYLKAQNDVSAMKYDLYFKKILIERFLSQ